MTRRADQLRDYLRGSKLPTDKMDTIFVGRIVDRLSHYVQGNDNVNMLESFLLPPPNEVWGKVICLQACVCAQGGCMVRGVHGAGGCLVETPPTATAAGGTHPTGMHSCFYFSFVVLLQQNIYFCNRNMYQNEIITSAS